MIANASQAINYPRVRGVHALLEDLDAESSPEMRLRAQQREAEADHRGKWSAGMPVMVAIGNAVRMGGLALGNLSASVGEYGDAGGEAGWLIELRWWQLNGMRPAQYRSSVGLRDEHEFSHAVRAVAAALLVRAMGAWAEYPEQWR